MTTNIILSGYILPLPSGYNEAASTRAAYHIGMDLMVSVDLRAGVTATYSDVTIIWEDLTLSEMKTIRSAWQDLEDQPQVAYTDPLGVSRYAKLMPGGKPFDSVGYVGKKNVSGVYEALFRVTFQMRVTP